MKNISVMIKPASAACNLRCRYCFYADISENRTVSVNSVMNEDTTELIIKRLAEALSEEGLANISFQGGEPVLAGLDYFRHFVSCMKRYPDIRVNYALQTNGTMITEEWADFFKENNFLIGVSLDGYQTNMDKYRFDAAHKSVYYRILDNIELLRKKDVSFNILTVVTNELAGHAKGLTNFYLNHHYEYVQLIPCLPGLEGTGADFYMKPADYEKFFTEFFDCWQKAVVKGHHLSVNLFDNLYSMLSGQMPYQCGMIGRCSMQYVIESNGDTYPCDFYCLDEYKLGNLREMSFEEMNRTEISEVFLKSRYMKAPCMTCRYRTMCNGGCRRQNICYLTDEECGYQKALDHILPQLSRMRKN